VVDSLYLFSTVKMTHALFAETPEVSPSMVWFKDESFHQTDPAQLELNWDPFNLTLNSDAKVTNTEERLVGNIDRDTEKRNIERKRNINLGNR
jgi:hypothetical protein